jgi:hypothetical protein
MAKRLSGCPITEKGHAHVKENVAQTHRPGHPTDAVASITGPRASGCGLRVVDGKRGPGARIGPASDGWPHPFTSPASLSPSHGLGRWPAERSSHPSRVSKKNPKLCPPGTQRFGPCWVQGVTSTVRCQREDQLGVAARVATALHSGDVLR